MSLLDSIMDGEFNHIIGKPEGKMTELKTADLLDRISELESENARLRERVGTAMALLKRASVCLYGWNKSNIVTVIDHFLRSTEKETERK